MALILPPVFPRESTGISECILTQIMQKPPGIQAVADMSCYLPDGFLALPGIWRPSHTPVMSPQHPASITQGKPQPVLPPGSKQAKQECGCAPVLHPDLLPEFLPVVLQEQPPSTRPTEPDRGGEVGMAQRWDLLVQMGPDAPQLLKTTDSLEAARYLQEPPLSSLENISLILLLNCWVFSACLERH